MCHDTWRDSARRELSGDRPQTDTITTGGIFSVRLMKINKSDWGSILNNYNYLMVILVSVVIAVHQ